MTPSAKALAIAMSDFSQEAWCAGWLCGLEYILWEHVVAGEQPEIKALADAAGGWIVWEWHEGDAEGEKFVPMARWLEMYAKEVARTGRGDSDG